MSEKVKITREQANEIEHKKNEIGALRTIKDHILDYYKDNYALSQKNIDEETLIKAFFIGYEVEEEYKIGDYVVYIHDNTVWQVVKKITEGNTHHDIEREGSLKNSVHRDHIRHATEKEIAQEKKRRFWHGLGRKVGEFRVGDIYYNNTHPNKKLMMIQDGFIASGDHLVLVTPVEQRLDQ